ncbi:MAG TPA: hypothetical protein VJ761_20815 [Ktedonobacteraceae bacterium]|nr:hypothetical protein [Ktedonobacteraceae bacterium]
MAHWFEDLSKTMGNEKMGRRTAMRRVAGTLAGVVLTSALPEVLWQSATHPLSIIAATAR